MKAKLKMHKNIPKSSKRVFEKEFSRMIERFNRKYYGTGARLKLTT